MATILLVHGLAASKQHWQPLLPYLSELNVINFEIPGHGESTSLQFDWENTVLMLHSILPNSDCVIYVLHSFAASFLPELVKIIKKNDKIILLEGIIHIDDAKWTQSAAFRDPILFENWLKKFKLGGRVALKSQLIRSHDKSDIDLWSTGFAEVNGNAIKTYSRKFVERLKNLEILSTLKNHANLISYVKGSKSNLSSSCLNTIRRCHIPLHTIHDSGHFPMLDNPKELYAIIKDIINEAS